MKKIYKLVVIALIVCFSTSLRAQTAGTLTFKFTELSHTGYQGNNHTLVVWIESAVPSPYNTTEETTHMSAMSGGTAVTSGTTHHGTLYTTHLRYCCGGNTTDHIPQWKKLNANSTTAATANGVTATSSSTLGSYAARTVTWNPTATIPDGSYRICIEETWNHNDSGIEQRYIPFTKGPSGVTLAPTADTAFSAISLVWAPTLASDQFSADKEMAVVYPNPSKGIFNLDFKTEVKNVKVLNTLGQVVYDESIDSSVTTKSVDMTSFNNGEYFVVVSNDEGSSTYKVILNK